MAGADNGDKSIAVVGSGLAGTMVAGLLRKQGYDVTLVERRADIRVAIEEEKASATLGLSTSVSKRSINLALSHRGQEALREMGLLEEVMKYAIKMTCRAMHSHDGSMRFQPYGKSDQAIHSVSRELLNATLLDKAESIGVKTVFDTKVVKADGKGRLTTMNKDGEETTSTYRLIIGADGAYSTIRSFIMRSVRADFSQHYIKHGYKELTIVPTKDGKFAMEPVNALHIWPRREFMMIALPNPDKTYTCTMFAPYKLFDTLHSGPKEDITAFFEREFPDSVPLIPGIVDQFLANPTGALVTMRLNPWNVADRMLVIGDAAHAVVPFYGQGMNCAFEDALALYEEVQRATGDDPLATAVPKFALTRQPAADALADLSYHNYVEMRDHTASTSFLMRKRLEGVLHSWFPKSWIPLYTMVAFTRIPYDEALVRAEKQDKIISRSIWVVGTLALLGVGAAAFRLRARM